jgi:hypothetical protein
MPKNPNRTGAFTLNPTGPDVASTSLSSSLSDRAPGSFGNLQKRDLRLACADGAPLRDRKASAHQILQHFVCETARHHGSHVLTTGRRS